MRYLRTPLDVPLFLFLVSALIGYWVSYDQTTSGIKLLLIGAAIILYYAIILLRGAPMLRDAAVWLFVLGEAALAVYFVAQTNFAAQPTKYDWLTQVGIVANRILPRLTAHQPHPNMVASALEIGLPFALALVVRNMERRAWLSACAASACAVLIACSLLLTTSRGSWLALVAVTIGAIVVFGLSVLRRLDEASQQRAVLSRRILAPLGLMAVALLVLIGVRVWNGGVILDSLGTLNAGGSALSRAELYAQTWDLIREYPFTGAGLGVFPLVLSAYALLIEVPFLGHAHNTYLALWIEQGVLGILALGWLLAAFFAWVWSNRRRLNGLSYAGIFAVAVWLLHGLTDAPLYESRALPLLFVPFALTIASVPRAHSRNHRGHQSLRVSRVALAVVALLATTTTVLMIFFGPMVLSTWESNLGAVAQARAELGLYRSGDRISEIRRRVDLGEAEANFRRALAIEMTNPTANRRLGLIYLARGDFDSAANLLREAFQVQPDHRAGRKALGYALAWRGEVKDAAVLLESIPEARQELELYAWWWGTQGKPELAKRAAKVADGLRRE